MRVLLHTRRPRAVNGAERYTVVLEGQLRVSPRIEEVRVAFQEDDGDPPGGRWDVVHGMDLAPHRAAFAARVGASSVMTSHVAGWQNVRQGWRTGRRSPLLRMGQLMRHAAMLWRQACALRDADAVIPVSRSTLDALRTQAPWSASRLHLVENGVDPVAFSAGDEDRGYGLFVGRLERVKQPQLAIAAFAKLGLPLRIVGTGPIEAELRASAPPNISFEGPVDDEALAGLYQGASVCVVPSQSEGYPLVVLEALSAGLPVVSTRSFVADAPVDDLVRWVPFGLFGATPWSEQTADAMVRALVAAVRDVWGTKTAAGARRRHETIARTYAWPLVVDRIIDVYERALAR